MREDDIYYYQKRAREERERGIACSDSTVALAHLRMAQEYDRMLAGLPRETIIKLRELDAI